MKQKEKSKIRPLTREEQKFAEKNHDLVYHFLNCKNYPVEEYYTVVIEAYLHACQIYLNREDLQQYRFSTIAYKKMSSAIQNDLRAKNRLKRAAEHGAISLNTVISDGYSNTGSRCYSNIIADSREDIIDTIIQTQEDRKLMEKIRSILSEQQMDIVLLKLQGFSYKDISRYSGLKKYIYFSELKQIKNLLRSIIFVE